MCANKKIISILLAVVLVLTSFPFATTAEKTLQESQNFTDGVEYTEDSPEEFTLPDIIKDDDVQAEEKFVVRAQSYETSLNMFVFRNNDGTYTKKIYSHPVKYIDDTGAVKDITTDIKSLSDGSYKTADNAVTTTFSKTLADGISLNYNDVSIKMVPLTDSSLALSGGISANTNASLVSDLSSDNKTVSYPYGNKTKLEYALTYTGFKEDIVVEEYTGQTEYTFTLYTNGLFVTETDDSFYLTDDKENIKATIGDIIIFTADEKNNTMGKLTAEEVKPGQIYVMTIHVDADYLKNENTLYPIRIDPTIEISYSNNGTGAIEDATINSTAGSAGTSGSLYIGKRETYGISRALMKFPGLNLNDIYSESNIISAKVKLRDLLCETTEMTIYAHTFTGNTWTESSISWSGVNANSYVTSPLDTITMSWYNGLEQETEHFYEFDITAAVKGWKSGTYSKDKGIIFKMSSSVENGSSYINRTLASYNRAEQKPVLEVVYNPKISLNYTKASVNEGNTKVFTATTFPANSTVTWRSNNTNVATISGNGTLTAISAGSTTITASVTDSGGTYSASCAIYVTIPNGVYCIQNKYSNKVADVYNNEVQTFTKVSQYTPKTLSDQYIDEALNQLWKIYHLGNGRYSIRPMHCLSMVLFVDNGYARAYNTGSVARTEEGVPTNGKWTITRTSGGMKISAAHVTNGTLTIGSNTTTHVALTVEADSGATYQRWGLQQVTTSLLGARLYDLRTNRYYKAQTNEVVRYVAPQESRSLSQNELLGAVYRSEVNNSQTLNWRSSNTNIATVNSSTGEVTGVSAGTVNIYSNTYPIGYTLIVTEIPNGTYFIKNRQNSKFVDIDRQIMADGTQIHQWGFHKGNTQKWEFKRYSDGYYYIRSCNTSAVPMYYLTVQNDSTAEGAKIVLQSSISAGSQWKITSTSNGAYKITAKTGESDNRVLAVEWTTGDTSTHGLDMEQKNYQDNDSYLDEWKLYDVVFSFVNYYDSSIDPEHSTDNKIISAIPIANNYVKTVFKNLFDIDFKTVGTPTYNNSIISGCSSPTTDCTDACGNCTQHHKNVIRVGNASYSLPRSNNQITIIWSNRFGQYCETVNETHHIFGVVPVAYAGVLNKRPVVNFYYIPGSTQEDFESLMSCILLHEVSHSFGLDDVYDTDWHDGEDGIQCVMEKSDEKDYKAFYENTKNGNTSPFCNYCEERLRTLVANKYFDGK